MITGHIARVASALVVAFALASCAATAPSPRDADDAPDEQAPLAPDQVRKAVRGAVEQYRQAYEVLTFDGLAPLYVQDREVEVLAQGSRYSGWDQVEGYLRELLGRAKEVRMRISNLQVVALSSKSAIATARIDRSIRGPVTSVDAVGVLSLALRLDDGHWRIVSEHLSYTTSTD